MFRWLRRRRKLGFDDLPERVQHAMLTAQMPDVPIEDRVRILRWVNSNYPGFTPAQLNLAAMLLESGEVEAAERHYQRLLDADSNQHAAVAGLATVAQRKGDLERAEQLAQQAIDAGYRWSPCFGVIAEARSARGDTQGAAEAHLTAYDASPHAWNHLQKYCQIVDRPYCAPMDTPTQPITSEQLDDLANFIEAQGAVAGCDHTFRLSRQWAEKHGVDVIDLYQFLNAHGGFCDCEVCMNVTMLLKEDDESDEDDEHL